MQGWRLQALPVKLSFFKIGQKYSTGMRFFAAPAMMPLPALANNQTFEIYEAAVSDENGYKNDFLKAIEPKLQKHKIAFLARGFNIGEELIGDEPHRHQRLAERGSRAELLERHSRRLQDGAAEVHYRHTAVRLGGVAQK